MQSIRVYLLQIYFARIYGSRMPHTTAKQQGLIRPGKGWYDLRKSAGYTKDAQLAVAMDVDPSTIYRFERGIGSPSSDFLAKALHAFGLGADDFGRLFTITGKKARRAA
jgi:DNA-binding XRE family transcriptional regulator